MREVQLSGDLPFDKRIYRMLLNMLMALQEVSGAVQAAEAAKEGYVVIGVGIGIGAALIGAGIGLGRIGGQAVEAIARQPEAANDIRGTALFIAFLMEGATIVAVIMSLVAKLI